MWVWDGNVESNAPPVAPAVKVFGPFVPAPISTRPIPIAVHVPNPSKVPGLVATDALEYIEPTGNNKLPTRAVIAAAVVTPVPPEAIASVADKPAAVPVVF